MKKTTITCDVCGKDISIGSGNYNYPLLIGGAEITCIGTVPYPYPRMKKDLCEDCASAMITVLKLYIKDKK